MCDLNYKGFIYLWTNKQNGMKYLGSHKGHINDRYIGSGLRFRAAVNKYGIDQFDRIIVDFCYSENDIKKKEQFYLDLYECAKSDQFYNISHTSTGGNMGQDYAKIADAMKNNNPNKGGNARRIYNSKHGSPNIGYKHTEENLKKFREQKMGDKNPNKEGLVGRLETWLQDPLTGEIIRYDSLAIAERAHSANHQSVWLHRKNRKKPYRGFYWYVGEEIMQIIN